MTKTPTRVVAGLFVAIALLAGARMTARAQAPAVNDGPSVSAVQVKITSPKAADYVTGVTPLKVEVTPPEAVTSVSFSIDGREVCLSRTPPFECDWDAGREVREHQVRVVVTPKVGERVVQTLHTKGLDGYIGVTEVEAVQVTVTVTDNGKFVQGLRQQAFHVSEDGRPQTISSFVSEDVPLELIVAVDVSASMAAAMPKLRVAVKDFLQAVPTSNQWTLLGFNDSIIEVTRKTTALAERLRAVDRLSPWGATALYDVIAQGIERLGPQLGRKALIVFTDGEDQGSLLTLDEVEQRLQASDVTLYMIGQGRGVSAAPLQKVMQRLADPTGGRALATDSIDKLHGAFEELLLELSHQYLLGYQSTNGVRDDTWRELKVQVDGPGRVRARKGYRAGLAK